MDVRIDKLNIKGLITNEPFSGKLLLPESLAAVKLAVVKVLLVTPANNKLSRRSFFSLKSIKIHIRSTASRKLHKSFDIDTNPYIQALELALNKYERNIGEKVGYTGREIWEIGVRICIF